jgi:signal transduction histidine kinase
MKADTPGCFRIWTTVFCFASMGVLGQNLKVIDSMRRALPAAHAVHQFNLLNTIGFEYRFSYPDSTISYCSRAFELGEKINLTKGLSRPLSFIGLAKANQGDYTTALDYHNKSIEVAQRQYDTLQIAHGFNNVGRIFYDKGDLVRAYNYFVKARDLFEIIHDKTGLAYVYRSLADVFEAKADYKMALENAKRAVALRKDLGDLRAMTSAYMELGLVYQELDSVPMALRQFEIADSIASVMSDRMTKAEITVGMAEILCKGGRSPEAGALAQEVLTSVTENNNQKVFLRARLLLARCDIYWSRFPSASTILERVLVSSEKSGNLTFQRDAAKLLAKVHTNLKNPAKAKEYQNIYQVLQAKLENEDLNREIERLQFQLLTEKTEKENELLKAEKVRDEAVIEQQRFENLLLLVVAFFVAILAVITWTVSRKRKAINRKLEEQNQHILSQREEISKQNEILSQSNKELDLLNHEKDTLMNIVAHDLKSPLNRISGLSHIMDREGNLNDQQLELLRLIQECTRGGVDLITGLLDVHALNEIRENPKPSAILFDEFLRVKVQALNPVAVAKGSEIRITNLVDRRVIADPSYMGRIIDNLLSNAIKFSPRNSVIEIAAGWKAGCVHLSVKDCGPGFSQHDIKLMYQKFRKLSAQPTAGESSHGLGLAIVKTLVDRQGGTIEVDTSTKGTEFLVRIPAEMI